MELRRPPHHKSPPPKCGWKFIVDQRSDILISSVVGDSGTSAQNLVSYLLEQRISSEAFRLFPFEGAPAWTRQFVVSVERETFESFFYGGSMDMHKAGKGLGKKECCTLDIARTSTPWYTGEISCSFARFFYFNRSNSGMHSLWVAILILSFKFRRPIIHPHLDPRIPPCTC